MNRNRRAIENSLRKKGFKKVKRHHRYYVFETGDGLITRIKTKVSHGGKSRDITPFHIAQMAKQCRLSDAQFLELTDGSADGSMGQPAYETILRDKGLV